MGAAALRTVSVPAVAGPGPASMRPATPIRATAVAATASLRKPRLGLVLRGGADQPERGSKGSPAGSVGGVSLPDGSKDSLVKLCESDIEIPRERRLR